MEITANRGRIRDHLDEIRARREANESITTIAESFGVDKSYMGALIRRHRIVPILRVDCRLCGQPISPKAHRANPDDTRCADCRRRSYVTNCTVCGRPSMATKCRFHARVRWNQSNTLDALATAMDDIGDKPSIHGYRDWRLAQSNPRDYPGDNVMRESSGTWLKAVALARQIHHQTRGTGEQK